MFRPEGFHNPYIVNHPQHDSYEAGADAMLEALKAKGIHGEVIYHGDNDYRIEEVGTTKSFDLSDIATEGKQGTFLFIPDESTGGK